MAAESSAEFEIRDWLDGALTQGPDGCWRPPSATTQAFPEGDAVHAAVLRVLRQASDLGSASPELDAASKAEGLEYHLGGSRANLLRGFDFDRDARVLEIGAGCGAVTRFLAEKVDRMLAVEGDAQRAAAAVQRVRDLPGAAVVQAPFGDLRLRPSADIVVAVGVLEYAHLYSSQPTATLAALSRWRGCLREGGFLVLAIENQLGLKYLAGEVEDHSRLAFDGLEGYARSASRSGVTQGLQRLLHLLRDAGFAETQVFLPFPDYKTPRAIIAADALDGEHGASLTGLVGSALRAPPWGRRGTFNQNLAWPTVVANGLGATLANSFLIVAAPSSLPDGFARWDAAMFNTSRKPEFWTATTLTGLGGTRPVATKRLMNPTAAAEGLMSVTGHTTAWQQAPALEQRLSEVMQRESARLSEMAIVLRPWADYLETKMDATGSLTGELVDALPSNGVLRDGTYQPFDTELTWGRKLHIDQVIMRGLYYSVFPASRQPGALRAYAGLPVGLLLVALARKLRPGTKSGVALRDFARLEADIQRELCDQSRGTTARALTRALVTPVPLHSGKAGGGLWAARRDRVLRAVRVRARATYARSRDR